VRHSIPASVALFSLLALPLVFVANSHAQTNGTPTAATSQGFGGAHPITAPFPMGGTLPGHPTQGQRQGQAQGPGSQVGFSTSNPSTGDGHHRHHHHYVEYTPPVIYTVPVTYAVDICDTDDDSDADDDDADYQGGPTVFDRRGAGADSYIPPVENVPTPHSTPNADSDPRAPEPEPEPTVLIFKDGRKLEVGNYAIVGATLFDLTAGHPRKVALADLDLQATQKQNDDHGVSFQIPQLPQAN